MNDADAPEEPNWLDDSHDLENPSGQMDDVDFDEEPKVVVASVESLDTLDESVFKTLGRDLMSMSVKLSHVIFPIGAFSDRTAAYVRNWDLYGPLAMTLYLGLVLALRADHGQKGMLELVFGFVFILVWAGSILVAVNAMLLGGNVSFFQTLCVMGYSLFPLNMAATLVGALSLLGEFTENNVIRIMTGPLVTWPIVVVFCLWAVAAAAGFIISLFPNKRKKRLPLAIFPIALFYGVLAWMIAILNDTS